MIPVTPQEVRVIGAEVEVNILFITGIGIRKCPVCVICLTVRSLIGSGPLVCLRLV